MRIFFATTLLCLVACFATGAQAHGRHHHHYHHRHYVIAHHTTHHHEISVAAAEHLGLVTVETAAGISIKVGRDVAANFQGLIRDYVAAGYKPSDISCWAPVGTHIAHSRHYLGHACDFAQTGWNKTDRFMYSQLSIELAHKWGFVSGCEFRSRKDCGHIGDDMAVASSGHRHYAARRHRYRHYAKG